MQRIPGNSHQPSINPNPRRLQPVAAVVHTINLLQISRYITYSSLVGNLPIIGIQSYLSHILIIQDVIISTCIAIYVFLISLVHNMTLIAI